MHYYRHHIGDYAAATAHLSILEDGAYSRLLRVYYRDEKPLPADTKAVQRIVGARSRDERDAVDAVLSEFFTLTDDGWRNKRADDEIEAFQEAEGESEEKKKHEKERKRRYRQRRSELFEALRDRGIVPRFDTSLPDLEAMLSRGTRRGQDADGDGDGTAITTNREPLTNSQEQESSIDDSSAPASPEAPARNEPIPYQAIVDAYNRTMDRLSKARDLTAKRRTRMRTAWTGRRKSVEFWEAYFAECQRDPFLSGEGPYKNGHENWRPDFDYLIREDVVVRTYERAISRMEQDNG